MIGEGVGVLGELAQVHLTLKDGSALTVIAKFSAVLDDTREFARVMGYYKSETEFYKNLAADTPVRTPHIYHQTFDAESYRFVIIMEEAKGTVGDQVKGCGHDEAMLIVSELAEIHSAWSAPERSDQFSWVRRVNDKDFITTTLAQFDMNLPLYLERYPEMVPDWLPKLEGKMKDLYLGCSSFFDSRPHTLVHGDYRLDNFVFEKGSNGKSMMVLDWQIILRTMASYDLGYFLFQSLDVENRRAWEKELVATYVEGRNAAGDTAVSADEIYTELPLVGFFCTLYPIIAGGLIDLTKPRSRPLIQVMSERAYVAMEDHNSLERVVSL